jgi:hypothetical protein
VTELKDKTLLTHIVSCEPTSIDGVDFSKHPLFRPA